MSRRAILTSMSDVHPSNRGCLISSRPFEWPVRFWERVMRKRDRPTIAQLARLALGASGALLVISVSSALYSAPAAPAYITAAIHDPERPPLNTDLDGYRKPAEVLAFAGVKPGDKVADYIPGNGYWTRIFSKIAGPRGRVYAIIPREYSRFDQTGYMMMVDLQLNREYHNSRVLRTDAKSFELPEQVDTLWTSQNYHDLHTTFMAKPDVAALNKAFFNAVKPGGTFIILDHAAAPGSGLSAPEPLHRIDPEAVKAEVQAAGFVLEAESSLLRNPNDPHTAPSSDPSIQNHTDQFILKFRKPE